MTRPRRYKAPPPHPIVLILHPGTVDTDLSVPFQNHVSWDLFPVDRGARQVLRLVEKAGPGDNGRFMDWKGEDIPW